MNSFLRLQFAQKYLNKMISAPMQKKSTETPISDPYLPTAGQKTAFGLILAIAAAFRIYYAVAQSLLFRDSFAYLAIIQEWGTAPEFFFAITFDKPPFFQFCAALLVRCGMDAMTAGHLLNVLAGIAIVALAFAIFRKLFDSPWLALGGMLLVATQPTLVRLSGEIMRENFMLMFSLMSFWCFQQAWSENQNRRRYLFHVFNSCLGLWLTTLSRYEGFATTVLIGIFLFGQKFIVGKKFSRRQWYLISLYVATALFCLAALLLIFQNQTKRLW